MNVLSIQQIKRNLKLKASLVIDQNYNENNNLSNPFEERILFWFYCRAYRVI